MSTTIDNRVVEMQFDNKHFENNVKTTLSTLDRLKQSLNLSGASKGLENVSTAAKKCDLGPMSSAVETVRYKFSALEVMAVTALANITNSAVNAGKRIVSALTIAPIKSGLQEYETQINAVQTILANTQSKGTNIDQVNAALDELNHYADKTIYNFTEMTRNIGTFTAAGVDLETSVASIKGIANLAAVSGSTSQQASTAMYQLSQALAAGKVSLMDWNSVVNAGMGGEVFQNALIRTSELLKTGAKDAIDTYGSFRESLTKGEWLTTEVLTETLKQISGAYSEAELISQGFTKEQAADIVALAQTAEGAATNVKTFTQLIDTTKEALQSGWTQTWETIVGDFEEAKEVFSKLSEFFGEIISDSAEFRNNFLSGALSSGWKQLLNAGITDVEGYKDSVRSLAKENGDAFEKMIEDSGSFEKALPKALENGTISSKTLSDGLTNLVHKIENMSDEERKAAGYTKENTEEMFALHEALRNGSISMDEFVAKMTRPSGRELIFDSLLSTLKYVYGFIKPIGDAFRKIFFPEGSSEGLYQSIKSLNDFTKTLVVTEETAGKLQRAFEGLFAAIDIVATILGGALSTAFKVVKGFLSAFDIGILDAVANIGDAIVALRDWIDAHFSVEEAAKRVGEAIKTAYGYVKAWIDAFLKLPEVQAAITKLKDAFSKSFDKLNDHLVKASENFLDFIERVKSMDKIDIGKILSDFFSNVVKPFFNFDGIFDDAVKAVKDFAKKIKEHFDSASDTIGGFVDKVRDFLKEHKNDLLIGSILAGTLAFAIGFGKIMRDLIRLIKPFAGIGDAFADVLDAIAGSIKAFAFKTRAEGIKDIAIALGILAASLLAISFIPEDRLWEVVGALGALAAGLAVLALAVGLVNVGQGSIAASLKNLSMGGTIVSIGLALLALAGALKIIDGLDLSFEKDKIAEWAASITTLTIILGELVAACVILSKFAPKLSKGSIALLMIAGAILLMCKAIEKIDGMTIDNPDQVLGILSGFVIGLGFLLGVAKGLSWGSAASVVGIAVGVILLVEALNMILAIDTTGIEAKLGLILGIFTAFIALMWVSQVAGQHAWQAGIAIMGMGAAAILIVGAMKILAGMEADDIKKAGFAIGQILIIFGLITMMSALSGQHAIKAGAMLILMSVAIGILAAVIAALSYLKPDGLDQAMKTITTLLVVLGIIVGVSYFAGEHATKAGIMLLMMSGAIAILAGVIWALSKIESGNMWSALAAIVLLEVVFMALIHVTSNANISWGTVAQLGIMLAIVVALAAVLWAMSALDVQNAIPNAAAISVLLLAMVGAMKILENAQAVSWVALGQLAIMAVIAGLVGSIIGLLCKYDLAPSIEAAIGISALVLALSAACLILASVGAVAGPALAGIGVLVILVGSLAILGYLIADLAFDVIARLPKVGSDLSSFMTNVTPFLNGIKMVDESCSTGAKALARAIKSLAVADLIAGLVNVGTLPGIGTHLSNFMANVTGFVTGVQTVTEQAAVGGKALKQAILSLSVADLIAGLTDVSSLPTIGTNLSSFMSNMQGFISSVGLVDETVVTGAQNLSTIIKTLTADDLSAKLSSWIPGESSLESFGSSLAGFYENIKGVDLTNLSTMSTDLQSITTAANSLASVNTGAIDSLATSLRNLGTVSVTNFVSSISTGAPRAAAAVIVMVNAAVAAASMNTGAFTTCGQNLVLGLMNGITAGGPMVIAGVQMVMTTAYMQVAMMSVLFQQAGMLCITGLINGVSSRPAAIMSTFSTMITFAIMHIRTYYSSFYSAGAFLVQGFAAGITAYTWYAEAQAAAMASAAYEAAKRALNINSPSRIFMPLGSSVVEGFAVGIEDNLSYATGASSNMATAAVGAVKSTISRIGDAISNGIDAQPTIRPVLDLSEVQNGAEAINGMFVDRSLALAGANIGISSNRSRELDRMFSHLGSMNDASNREVVTAITSLRGDFADLVTAISKLQVRMDSGTLVGEIIGKIDTSLGQMATYKGRRN